MDTQNDKGANGWKPDVLDGYEQKSLTRATLVRRAGGPAQPRAVVLNVHGYNDYFFHTHVAEFFSERDIALYGVDLRRAGRSLRPGDSPHLMSDVAEQGEDIGEAVAAAAAEHPGAAIVVHGHSTGGLQAVIWAADHGHPALAGVALNSPLFGRRDSLWIRFASHALPLIAWARPNMIVGATPAVYSAYQHVSNGGRWDFDLEWKRPQGVPARAAWANAVRRAQLRVLRGLTVGVPVLVARSDSSGHESVANPLLDSQDTVTDVHAIARLGARLGPDATPLVIPGGVHDLTLSAEGPRMQYLDTLAAWVDRLVE